MLARLKMDKNRDERRGKVGRRASGRGTQGRKAEIGKTEMLMCSSGLLQFFIGRDQEAAGFVDAGPLPMRSGYPRRSPSRTLSV